MKILLFGKNGQVGRDLDQNLKTICELTSFDRSQLDVTESKLVEQVIREHKPDLVINASAYTDVDRAETESKLAMQINGHAPGIMAYTAKQSGAGFIHYSTDYVFDGNQETLYKETDKTNPINVYGKSKLAGEANILQAGGAYIIFRTSWVYSMRKNTFVKKTLAWAQEHKTLRIVDDQISNPTWANDLAQMTVELILKCGKEINNSIREHRGIYHAAGTGYTSRYEWAKEILANASNRDQILTRAIEPVSSSEFPLPAARPGITALDCSKLEKTFQLKLPDWKISLKTAMNT